MSMSSSRRVGRLLTDVRQDIDNFLDPKVLTLASEQKSKSALQAAAQQASDAEIANSELRLQILDLQSQTDALSARYDEVRHDADHLRVQGELQASSDARELAKLRQECHEATLEGREKKRRLKTVEDEKELLRCERDALKGDQEDARGRAEKALADLKRSESDNRRLEAEVQCLRSDLAAMLASRDSLAVAPPEAPLEAAGSADDKARIETLEKEIARLNLEREQTALDRDLSSQLRQKHKEYEAELIELRAAKAELAQIRTHALKLEQEETALRAALEARSNALREAEELASGANLAKRDLAAFITAASSIISDPSGDVATPRDLSLAWSKLQSEVSTLRGDRAEAQKTLEEALQNERQAQIEIRQLRASLASLQVSSEEQKLELHKAQDESSTLSARISVLREALSKRPGEGPASAASLVGTQSELQVRLDSATKQSEHFQAVAKTRQTALDSLNVELESLRKEHSKLYEVEAKARQLQLTNDNLRQSNAELEREQQRLTAEVDSARREASLAQGASVAIDYDPSTTKVLHFRHGPGADIGSKQVSQESESLRVEVAALRKELHHLRLESTRAATPAGDLECRQASRQLERFKKATKKYVQDYREGMYGLLGWKVEMKGEGNSLNWHLTSRYHDEELVFQLRQGESSSAPEFDLLSTPWGEQLQADRHAMAFLEVYRSIPGFLAHITTDLLSRQTIPS